MISKQEQTGLKVAGGERKNAVGVIQHSSDVAVSTVSLVIEANFVWKFVFQFVCSYWLYFWTVLQRIHEWKRFLKVSTLYCYDHYLNRVMCDISAMLEYIWMIDKLVTWLFSIWIVWCFDFIFVKMFFWIFFFIYVSSRYFSNGRHS